MVRHIAMADRFYEREGDAAAVMRRDPPRELAERPIVSGTARPGPAFGGETGE
jgi:hypothetical protein